MSNPGNKNQIIWDKWDGNLNPGEWDHCDTECVHRRDSQRLRLEHASVSTFREERHPTKDFKEQRDKMEGKPKDIF